MTRVWLLDLDNTLHDAMPVVFPRINRAMTDYLARELALGHEEANALRMQYWRRYGATLLGMIRHHGTDPHHFLRETHPFPDIALIVKRDMRLVHALRRLSGRRIVVTNAPLHYASQVVRALGIWAHIESIVSIEAMSFAGACSRNRPGRCCAGSSHACACRRRAASSSDSVANLAGAPRRSANRTRDGHQPPFAPSTRRTRAGPSRRVDVRYNRSRTCRARPFDPRR